MTREEAIETLTSKDVCNSDMMLEALDMAIKALKERPIEEKILIVDKDIPSLMLRKGEGKVFYDNARHQIIVPACYINLEVVNELKELKLKEVEE